MAAVVFDSSISVIDRVYGNRFHTHQCKTKKKEDTILCIIAAVLGILIDNNRSMSSALVVQYDIPLLGGDRAVCSLYHGRWIDTRSS